MPLNKNKFTMFDAVRLSTRDDKNTANTAGMVYLKLFVNWCKNEIVKDFAV